MKITIQDESLQDQFFMAGGNDAPHSVVVEAKMALHLRCNVLWLLILDNKTYR